MTQQPYSSSIRSRDYFSEPSRHVTCSETCQRSSKIDCGGGKTGWTRSLKPGCSFCPGRIIESRGCIFGVKKGYDVLIPKADFFLWWNADLSAKSHWSPPTYSTLWILIEPDAKSLNVSLYRKQRLFLVFFFSLRLFKISQLRWGVQSQTRREGRHCWNSVFGRSWRVKLQWEREDTTWWPVHDRI